MILSHRRIGESLYKSDEASQVDGAARTIIRNATVMVNVSSLQEFLDQCICLSKSCRESSAMIQISISDRTVSDGSEPML